MLTIRFYNGNPWNPLHMLIMLVTRSRVVHCDFAFKKDDFSDSVCMESTFPEGVFFSGLFNAFLYDIKYEFNCEEIPDYEPLIGTPYDYRAALAYIWPWVKQDYGKMNCVEVCLWATKKAGLPTPKWLPTPGGLERWCRKLKKEGVK